MDSGVATLLAVAYAPSRSCPISRHGSRLAQSLCSPGVWVRIVMRTVMLCQLPARLPHRAGRMHGQHQPASAAARPCLVGMWPRLCGPSKPEMH